MRILKTISPDSNKKSEEPQETFKSPQNKNNNANKLLTEDRKFHDWYRFVLSFPPHLVREYIKKFELHKGAVICDPFCGTGTTLVEAKLHGFSALGFEANAMAFFASQTKTNWSVNSKRLEDEADRIADLTIKAIRSARKLRRLPDEQEALLLKNSICEIPLHKTLILRDTIRANGDLKLYPYCALALASSLVNEVSNLHFGPEVGVRGRKEDADVANLWRSRVKQMAADLVEPHKGSLNAKVLHLDSRLMNKEVARQSIDCVFTSPPYPNEKDYTRTTRLESVVLGFVTSKQELRDLKKGLLRSNTRNVYKVDDDDSWINSNEKIMNLAYEIEAKRIQLKKTSGFEKLYARVTKLYFGGMAKHLAELRPLLKPGAQLGYVVGDQASYFRIMIRTGQLLAEIAEGLGYEVVALDLFRTRIATATKEQLREEVLLLRWPG